MKPLLDRIVAGHYCVGCGLCASLAEPGTLEMAENAAGFLVPHRRKSGAEPPSLREFCPGITLQQARPHRGPEKIYGPFESLWTAHAVDEGVRRKASSGGCISALLIYLLEQGAVDGVLHVGKSADDPLRNQTYFSVTREDVLRRAGSRYAPSALLAGWTECLRTGRKIAVVGKPCDIAAIDRFLALHPEYEPQVICKISFLCMGVPSQNGTTRLVAALGLAEADVRDFWYRGEGWPGKATAIDAAGARREMSYEESWGRILSKDVNFRCKFCPDGFGEFADISCGDAWHAQEGCPDFAERPGRSLAFIRSERGRKLFEAARAAGCVAAEPFAVEDLKTIQPSQYQRKIHAGVRIAALKLMGDRLLDFSGFCLLANLGKARLASVVRNFWGAVRRRRAA